MKQLLIKKKYVTERNKNIWYNENIKQQKKLTCKKENKWRNTCNEIGWSEFKCERNKLTKMIRNSKSFSISEKVKEAGKDSKAL
jgi:hypothetical protein